VKNFLIAFGPAIVIIGLAAIALAVWGLRPAKGNDSVFRSEAFLARKADREQAARWKMMCLGPLSEQFQAMREAFNAGKLDPCNKVIIK
jgi:hypothetical protein